VGVASGRALGVFKRIGAGTVEERLPRRRVCDTPLGAHPGFEGPFVVLRDFSEDRLFPY